LLVNSEQGRLLESHLSKAHFSEPTACRAIESRQMFQPIDIDHVIKLDLYVRCLIPG